jgi:hypothetical protein
MAKVVCVRRCRSPIPIGWAREVRQYWAEVEAVAPEAMREFVRGLGYDSATPHGDCFGPSGLAMAASRRPSRPLLCPLLPAIHS